MGAAENCGFLEVQEFLKALDRPPSFSFGFRKSNYPQGGTEALSEVSGLFTGFRYTDIRCFPLKEG